PPRSRIPPAKPLPASRNSTLGIINLHSIE
ncbi:hypothetical protein A2U01_0089437, partial [Trifolium medium]|nr:hypothetical protein [Trifolium medium]